MIPIIALVLASFAFGLGLVAVFGDAWLLALRAELWERAMTRAFNAGYRSGKDDGKRMR